MNDLHANSGRQGIIGAITGWFCNPGYTVVKSWRLAKQLRAKSVIGRILAIWFQRSYIISYGNYISLEAKIGEGLVLPHPTGIVIGDGSIIGNNVMIYQNVTLGRSTSEQARYPQIGDNAIIYAGSVLLGDIKIGKGAIVGANSVVTIDVPENCTAVGAPARILG